MLVLPTDRLAREVLEHNFHSQAVELRDGPRVLTHTVPSRHYYVHQWLWDSCTHAMGLVHFAPERAYDELRSLVAGQWDNGHIGAITYHPNETRYYPRAENWATDAFTNGELKSTGITQPPLLATAVKYVYEQSVDRDAAEAFLDDLLPAVVAFHDYLKRHRDPGDRGLLTVIHPWESGNDNSPRWTYDNIELSDIPRSVIDDVDTNRLDDKAGAASHRPTQHDYYRFMYLIHLGNEVGWDPDAVVEHSPFAVNDVQFDSLWVVANEALADLLATRSDPRAARYRDHADQTRSAISETWSHDLGQFCTIDVSRGRRRVVTSSTHAMFVPLWARALDDEQLEIVLDRLVDPLGFWTEYPVPSTPVDSPDFDVRKYWRGPTWPISNLFVIEGLAAHAERSRRAHELRIRLTRKTLDMIEHNGFWEYFDPTNGRARPGRDHEASLGFGDFSWTAAVYLYLRARFA